MRNLICIPLLLLSFCLFAEDKPTIVNPPPQRDKLPSNSHEFDWEAVSKDGIKLRGHGLENNAGQAFVFAFKELDRLASDGFINAETLFEIKIVWKGKEMTSHYIARTSYPVLLPRGPNKEKELPRGPSRETERPRGGN